jgi:hypothetical protein
MFSLDLPAQAPKDLLDVLFLPAVLFFFTLMLWFSQYGKQIKTGKRPVWWFLFLVPMIFGFWVGFRNLFIYFSYAIYRADMPSGRMIVAHWLSFLMPAIAYGIARGWQYFKRHDRAF